jgi:succinate dehydrogenase/fumarate reductase flavoprotein subunit
MSDADVVVLGFGSAGVAAALTAARAGASVLVLEKQPRDAHTPTAKAAGPFVLSATDDALAARYLDACADGLIPAEVTAAWAHLAVDLHEWILKACPELEWTAGTGMHAGAAHPFPGAEAVRTMIYRTPSASGLPGRDFYLALQDAALAEPNVEVRWGTRAESLARDGAGRVVGVRARREDGSPVEVSARSGVVLATGGFEGDEQLKAHFLPAHPMYFGGNPANTGDGLRMAAALGADLWHTNGAEGRQCLHVDHDGRPLNFQMNLLPGGFVVLDRYGHRFCDEYRYTRIHTLWYEMLAYDAERREHPRIPSHWLFDHTRFAAGPLTPPSIGPAGMGLYTWSDDNQAELERGWVLRGDTVEEVAALAGLDPDAAAASVAAYNAACAGGTDAYGRTEGLVPLATPPYYVVRLHPGGVSTTGGPRHDEAGRVLDVFGAVIDGLYSAGTVGQMIGRLYPGPGSGWSEALCAGRLAGATAASA